ncbi:type I restriction endonuclease subunit R [bacterium]|nr:type I restriction endonuclease subunit R [bacterium]
MSSTLNIVALSNESTVVTEYIPEQRQSTQYQSEADLEEEFIKMLVEQGYERLCIHSEPELIANLRRQLELLNNYDFTESEWQSFFKNYLANPNDGIVQKTRTVQDDCVKVLRREDGSSKNIALIDKKDIHSNRLQVLNQYAVGAGEGARYDNRYDVTVLVNGLPLVHIELKKRGVALREAFNQINRYQRDSFWSGSGLYEYVQIFVISNGTHTKYYSNTTRSSHLKELERGGKGGVKAAHSFEFTSFWADRRNKIIPDLVDFTRTFFSKHTLLNILTKYCVFTCEDLLLVMRPYQIAAAESILNRLQISFNQKRFGSAEGGGYIWHTTGSGKTLTSFKTAQLASWTDYIKKVLFVVDRQDLDYQTMKEYDRFEKGAANSNSDTKVLKKQLEDDDAKIIITTVQKLNTFIKKNKEHEVYGKHIVIIFDECHRSQFGEMHKNITSAFKKYYLFGFTGTPIFAENSQGGGKRLLRTTEQAFGVNLHHYTIVDAINDGNVLPFRIDYVKTVREKEEASDKEVSAIDRERALHDPERLKEITSYILENFARKTKRNENYSFSRLVNVESVASVKNRKAVKEEKRSVRVSGFNSIFAVDSIGTARMYYDEFKRQQSRLDEALRLKIALIYSYGVNEEVAGDLICDENNEDTESLSAADRDFLEAAIADYNIMFGTSYDTSGEKFGNYYKDVSLRLKNREIDILIVVNMFLTGFDAVTLNTLWVDKNLRYHGLLQAFSRTNRIFNSVKTFGNIVCFRNLEEAANRAIALFGDEKAGSTVILRSYEDYYYGYDGEDGKRHAGYVELIDSLCREFPLGEPITGEQEQKDFIRLYGAVLRARNILSAFDQFAGHDVISERDLQDYQSRYIDLREQFMRGRDGEKELINDDIVFEVELIKQVEVNIDYILSLVKEYQQSNFDKEILISVDNAVGAGISLRSKLELIHDFIKTVSPETDVDGEWLSFAAEKRRRDLEAIIEAEKLKPEETRKYMSDSFRDGSFRTIGTAFDSILPPVSRFGGKRAEKKRRASELLKAYFDKYIDLFFGIGFDGAED